MNRRTPKYETKRFKFPPPQSNTTVSYKEEQIFAKLFQKMVDKSAVSGALAQKVGTAGSPAVNAPDRNTFIQQFPESLRPLARQAAEKLPLPVERSAAVEAAPPTTSDRTSQASKSEGRDAAKLRAKRIERIQAKLDAAETDTELWAVLEKEVFESIKGLDVDDGSTSQGKIAVKKGKRKGTKKAKGGETSEGKVDNSSSSEGAVDGNGNAIDPTVSYAYPHLLLHTVQVLKRQFPTSALSLVVLPHIKSMGRLSYALGASTALYNETISVAWAVTSNFSRVEALLNEMVDGGVEPNEDTLDVLFRIKGELEDIEKGEQGPALRAIWAKEPLDSKLNQVEIWIKRLREGLEQNALRIAHEKEARGRFDEDQPFLPQYVTEKMYS